MVWTPAQTMVFLDAARRHRLHALWRLITTRGLRRGEGCGLRRPDTDLDAALTTIRWQITQLGWDPVQGAPKSDAGERTVALDADTVTDMRRWRREQDKEKEAAGDDWADCGFEFTDELGNPLHPAAVTDMFHMLAYLAGLPPIRLHDLRHGAATLLLAAGHDMKVVQETLGLSSITIAADTYTSVLPQLARKSAEDVAALIRPAPQPPATPAAPPRNWRNAEAPRRRPPRPPARQGSEHHDQQQPAPANLTGTWHATASRRTPATPLARPRHRAADHPGPPRARRGDPADLPDPAQRLPVRGRIQPRYPGRRDHRRGGSRAKPASAQDGRCRARAGPGPARTQEGNRKQEGKR